MVHRGAGYGHGGLASAPEIPQLKDLGFIVADGAGFWVEVRRNGSCAVTWAGAVIPAITVTHRHA